MKENIVKGIEFMKQQEDPIKKKQVFAHVVLMIEEYINSLDIAEELKEEFLSHRFFDSFVSTQLLDQISVVISDSDISIKAKLPSEECVWKEIAQNNGNLLYEDLSFGIHSINFDPYYTSSSKRVIDGYAELVDDVIVEKNENQEFIRKKSNLVCCMDNSFRYPQEVRQATKNVQINGKNYVVCNEFEEIISNSRRI